VTRARRTEREPQVAAVAPPAPGASRDRWAVEALLVLAAALLAVYRTRERDFWFHLAAGRSIVEHGLPATERWCLAAFGQWPWLGEWLYHVALFAVRGAGGDLGVALWRAAWSGLALALALALARAVRADLWAVALLSPLVLAVARSRLAARPEQVSVALVLLFLLAFERARRGGRDRTAWLLPVGIAWANLHPGWFLGPLIAALHAAFAALDRANRRRALRWGLLALALYAAGAVTPRPLDTLSLRLVRDVGADPMVGTIEELRPWQWPEDRTQPYTGLVLLALAGAALGARRAWRASGPLTLATLAGLGAGCLSYRFRALGAVAALPLLATALAPAWPWTSSLRGGSDVARDFARRLAPAVLVLAALAGGAWLLADAKYFPPGVTPLYDSVPMRAVALADSLGLDGPVLDTPWYGGYILWARGERHLPLQDTRNLGSAAFRSRFVRARLDPAALDSLIAEWGFTHAVLEPPMDPLDQLARQLFHRPDWALVFADDAGLLFVRRDLYPAIAAARAYRLMTPDYSELGALAARALADPELRRGLVAELERARRESPWDARASLWLGLMALAGGQPHEALAHFDRVERLAPVTPGLALRQGLAYEQVGDAAGARRAYRRALRDTADAADARAALGRLGR
jgi:tetratricopeptide (TPR) repeat protein